MQDQRIQALAERFLSAWNSQEIERVVACYTEDLIYRDPNTRGEVQGADAMRRYLKKLFSSWVVFWSLREAYPLSGRDGVVALWRASFRRKDAAEAVDVDGMELLLFQGDLVARNEIHFDRAALTSLR